MSSKFYWFLWAAFFLSAGVLWLGGAFTLTTLVVYGFIAFGLVFTGMMCVLPNVVSHPTNKAAKPKARVVFVDVASKTPPGSATETWASLSVY
jgi:hypothetical protein